MLPGKVIQVFEHSPLRVEEQGLFRRKHFERLVRYNELHGNKYFRVGHRSIYFESYVGVIQVGDLVIEVLPKADRDGVADKNKWHEALIRMLHACRELRLESLSEASLKLRSMPLLDLYFQSYLEEVAYLVHCGLIKQYRKQQGQVGSLKGRLLFQQQIARNLVTNPRLMFMDEPTGGLDVSVQARVLDLLRGIVAEFGLAAIIVTHDLAVARLLAHRTMVMKGGAVIETGLTDRVLDDPQEPYTQLLVSSILPP